MAHSPHRRWKGCCMLCASWIRGDGKAQRMRFSQVRKVGAKRRLRKPTMLDD